MLDTVEERIERVKTIMAEYGLNASQFAEKVNIDRSNLSSMLNGNRVMGEGVLNKIIVSFDNIDKNWLFEGVGSMFKTGNINIKGDGNISNTGYTGGNYTSSVNGGNNEGYILSDEGEEFFIPAGLPKEIYPKINQLLARLRRLEADNEQLRKDKAILQDFVTMLNVKKNQ